MSYTESIVKYGDKDSLPSGDSEKRIYGTELQAEFDAIGATFEEMRDENGLLPGTGSGEGIDVGSSEGEITYWDGLKWTPTSEVKVEPELQRVSIGAPAYTSKLFLNGDAYMGMSANFYGQILPTNPDDKPGTFFCGGMSMLGSYIEGQPLTPINQDETNDPSLIRQRAFERDAAMDMALNPIYNAGDPDDPQWAQLRDRMCPTVGWIERNAIVSNENGDVVSRGNTQFGDSNDDQHVIIGDTYIGYTEADGKPDNNDTVGGTLFLNRGMIVGRGNTGNASIGMEGNVIFDLGDPVSDSCAVSKGYVQKHLVGDLDSLEDDVDLNEVNITNLYHEQIKQAMQIQGLQNQVNEWPMTLLAAVEGAEDFSQLKSELINALTGLMEMQR